MKNRKNYLNKCCKYWSAQNQQNLDAKQNKIVVSFLCIYQRYYNIFGISGYKIQYQDGPHIRYSAWYQAFDQVLIPNDKNSKKKKSSHNDTFFKIDYNFSKNRDKSWVAIILLKKNYIFVINKTNIYLPLEPLCLEKRLLLSLRHWT